MKVIIAGGRNFHKPYYVEQAVKKSGFDISEIVSGGAIGVDALGEDYARRKQIRWTVFPAKWDDIGGKPAHQIKTNKFGKKYWSLAGFERNTAMAEYADALIAVWDGKSRGTKYMIDTAKERGLWVYIEMVN